MAALRELEALKLIEVIHGRFDRAQGQRQCNLYRLTFAGAGCGDAWREFEPDGDTADARREAEARARTAVTDAEAKAAGARADRAARRASRRPWDAPAPVPQPDEWAGYEPDEAADAAASGPLETQDLGDAGPLETPEPETPTSPAPELVHESGMGTINKSPGREGDSRELHAESAASDAADEPGPAVPADAPEQIVMVEGLIALYRDGRRERTRAEALAHFARLGLIVLDSGRAFHPGYR